MFFFLKYEAAQNFEYLCRVLPSSAHKLNVFNVFQFQIPTDGLVLRGFYTAITLAVLGHRADIQVNEEKIADADFPPVDVEAEIPPADVLPIATPPIDVPIIESAESPPGDGDLIPALPSDLGPINEETDYLLPSEDKSDGDVASRADGSHSPDMSRGKCSN